MCLFHQEIPIMEISTVNNLSRIVLSDDECILHYKESAMIQE